jgi:monoamine oxidase
MEIDCSMTIALNAAGLGRRGALALLGSAALARPALAQNPQRRQILVLGAGMSGLTAALSLLRAGHDVTVIEYQNRVGGRLLSVPIGAGQWSEAGGGHFRANMPYVLHYLRQFRLPLNGLNDGLPRYVVQGQRINSASLADWPLPLHPSERNMTVASNLWRYLARAGFDADTVLDHRWPTDEATLARVGNATLGAILKEVGASDAFLALLDAHAGLETQEGQALSILPDLAYHFGDQNLFRVQEGNHRLPQALAQAIGMERIHLASPVRAIDQSGGRIRVSVEGGRDFTGDAVISTIPFSVMDGVQVTPGWSNGKQRMFREMEWEKTVKVILQTRTPQWLKQNIRGWPVMGGDQFWERIIDITGNEPGDRGNVFFYLNGSNAQAFRDRPGPNRAQDFLAEFRAQQPDFVDEPTFLDHFDWAAQPWIRGSFAGIPIGGGWMIKEWEAPEGRIHFAGDWTTLKSGWVEGAIESGLRAARQIDPACRAEGNPLIRQELLQR